MLTSTMNYGQVQMINDNDVTEYLKIDKYGKLSIPKSIKKLLPFKEGEIVSVYQEGKDIIIEDSFDDTIHNQCIYQNSRITIPAEIRNLQGLNNNTPLMVNFTIKEKKLFLRK
jgi:bifunctional DNA-binding transcriptional regulator/antitoxin component of YhaV-PrlF toxin-antitoxin module